MRVGFDEQIFLLQKRGGVSRYFVELIREFSSNSSYGIEPIIDFKSTSNEMLFELSNELDLGLKYDDRPKPLAVALESVENSMGNSRVDLIHHTFYSKLFWQPRFRGPRVSTHHDMIPEMFSMSRFGINPHLSKRWYFNKSDRIISVSESAKNDLVKTWPEVLTPISTIHHGSSDVPHIKIERLRGNVLFVGKRDGYKDATTLIRAFAKVPAILNRHLQFVGGGPFTDSEKALFAELGIAHLVSQADLSDAELSAAYSSAHVFVFPSKYEGFGLPVLEAFQHQCRVLLSEIEVFKEIAGDAAQYFPPGDVSALSRMLSLVLSEDPNVNPFRALGMHRAQEFKWSRTASLTAEIYKSLLTRS